MEYGIGKYKTTLLTHILKHTHKMRSLTDKEHWEVFCYYDDMTIPELEIILSEIQFDPMKYYKETGVITVPSPLNF